MGLDGRGRWYRWDKRRTVDEYLRLDAVQVSRLLDLSRVEKGALEWGRASIAYQILPGVGLRIAYAVNGRPVEPYLIPISWTDQANIGGKRPWWLCPGCGRRCRYLYGGRLFLCRECHGLTYVTSQKSKAERPMEQVRARMWAIRRRLRATGGLWDPLPDRPKGMHRRTYARLVGEYAELRTLDLAGFFLVFGVDLPPGVPDYATLWGWCKDADLERFEWLGTLELMGRMHRDRPEPERLTLGELAAAAGVPYAFAKEAAAAGLVRPDWGRGTRRKRYRAGLADWLAKLHCIRADGLTWEDIRAWTKRRWDPGHEHERNYPAALP